jgi:hypothetical protein
MTLFWRILVSNAAILALATAVLVASPATAVVEPGRRGGG